MATILRLLILAGIVWLVYSFIKRAINTSIAKQEQPHHPPPSAIMQKCTQCGVHVPENEATILDGLFFCNTAHRDLYLQRKP